jgi:hypothetical protein
MIDYLKESEKYRPINITTLLIGEAPPPSGDKYFYVPQAMSVSKDIEKDTSLPATIFYRYFKTRPTTREKYIELLEKLKEMGVFLIDIYNEPVRIRERNKPPNIQPIVDAIPKLREKMILRGIKVPDENIVFLLARNNYKKVIKQYFPYCKMVSWIDFRLSRD